MPTCWSTFQFNRLLARADSRVVAASWVTSHVPEGALIEETGTPWTHIPLQSPGSAREPTYRQFAFKTGDMPDVLIMPTSPRLPADDETDGARALADRYRKVCAIEAFDSSSQSGIVYDWQDEFYLPLAGFSAVRSPGPNLSIYARPELATARGWAIAPDCSGR
jgi:hypothetical protein